MRLRRSRPRLRLLAGLAGAALLCSGVAAAQEDEERDRRNFTVTPFANERLLEAQEALSNEQYAEALAAMQRMEKRKSLTDHERALMYQTFGYIHAAQEDFVKATAAFEKCLAIDYLPKPSQLNVQYNVAQLYMAQERFDKAIVLLEDWMTKVTNPNPAAHYLLAIAYVQQEDFDEALPHAQKAVDDAPKPVESWLQLLLSVRFERGEIRKVAEILEVLVQNFPKKSYWVQLSQIYFELKEEWRSLAAMELAYRGDMLDRETELTHLASLYLLQEVPYKAANVLEKGIAEGVVAKERKNYEMLANAWLHAREYEQALEPLSRAAELSDDGNLYVQLAQVHLERERWEEARAALMAAVDKGDLSDEGNAYLLLGMTHFNTRRLGDAKRAFQRAATHEGTKTNAIRWLEFVHRERQRAEREAEAAEAEAAREAEAAAAAAREPRDAAG